MSLLRSDSALRDWLGQLEGDAVKAASQGAVAAAFSGSDSVAGGRAWWGDGTAPLMPFLGGALPGSDGTDYDALAGDYWLNSVVMVCLGWMMDAVVQAEWDVEETKPGDEESQVVAKHPLTSFLHDPCPYYAEDALRQATVLALKCHGNAYWCIERRGHPLHGPIAGVRWLPPWDTWPAFPRQASNVFISHYEHRVGSQVVRIDPENIVHFRDGIDPANNRVGLSRLRSGLQSLVGVNEADAYLASLMRNMAVPTTLFTPAVTGDVIDEDEGNKLVDNFHKKTGGRNRGRSFALNLPVTAQQLGLSPEDLALDRSLSRPTQTLCALLRISPLVVGLEDDRGTYENTAQARKAAWEDALRPVGRGMARVMTRVLLPQFGGKPAQHVAFNDSKVPALQEGKAEREARATAVLMGGLGFYNEARVMAGLPEVPGGERLLLVNGQFIDFARILEDAASPPKAEVPPALAEVAAEGDEANETDPPPDDPDEDESAATGERAA